MNCESNMKLKHLWQPLALKLNSRWLILLRTFAFMYDIWTIRIIFYISWLILHPDSPLLSAWKTSSYWQRERLPRVKHVDVDRCDRIRKSSPGGNSNTKKVVESPVSSHGYDYSSYFWYGTIHSTVYCSRTVQYVVRTVQYSIMRLFCTQYISNGFCYFYFREDHEMTRQRATTYLCTSSYCRRVSTYLRYNRLTSSHRRASNWLWISVRSVRS